MRVAVVNITNGGLSGGAHKYLEVMAPLMAMHPDVSHLDLFAPPIAVERLRASTGLAWKSWSSSDPQLGFRGLRSELRNLQPDVVFIPSARWIDCDSPVVAMVRNMEPLALPFAGNPWMEVIRTLGRRWVAKRVCRKAVSVIAVSEFVSQYLLEQWRLESSKVRTIYHGIDLPRSDDVVSRPHSLANLETPFLFTAGSVRPYRFLEDAIGALPAVLQQRRNLKLVIGGETERAMLPYRSRLQRQAESLGCAEHIIWCGKLTAVEMAWCFQQCESFLMTSRVEACPNTVLEAMAHSCLSVSTAAPPMPEMYGDTAFFYDAGDCSQMASQVLTALSLTPSQRSRLQSAARSRASQFSWKRTVDRTVAELVRVAKLSEVKRRRRAAA